MLLFTRVKVGWLVFVFFLYFVQYIRCAAGFSNNRLRSIFPNSLIVFREFHVLKLNDIVWYKSGFKITLPR